MPKILRIRNFGKFQHYKTRNPPWIKVYSKMLDDYSFHLLPDSTKFHCVGLMLLASRLDNILPNDRFWLGHKIGANSEIDINLLIEFEFLEFSDSEEKQKPSACVSENEEIPKKPEKPSQSPNGHKSQFSLAECLKYAESCDGIKNPRGLANSIFKSGESDYLILKTLYPERVAAEDEKQFGPKREFTDEPCTVCFGGKMKVVESKGAKPCDHCQNEKGKSTGLEPKYRK
jgi:hypothetical protein